MRAAKQTFQGLLFDLVCSAAETIRKTYACGTILRAAKTAWTLESQFYLCAVRKVDACVCCRAYWAPVEHTLGFKFEYVGLILSLVVSCWTKVVRRHLMCFSVGGLQLDLTQLIYLFGWCTLRFIYCIAGAKEL